jgi:hydroxypyruvate reductase
MKPDIIIVAKLHQPTQEILEKEFTAHRLYEAKDRDAFLKELAPKVKGIASGGSGVNAAMMDALPNLKLISHFGVGYDSVDVDAAKKRGIRVTNTPDVLNDCVADTAMALTLNTLRKLPQSEAYLRSGFWATKGGYPLATSLGGKTMGIVGLGRIGEAIAKRAMASGMKIAYHNRNKKDVPYAYHPDPVSLAKASDVLMLVTPGGAETKNLVNAKVLDALGPKGYLVNISRGSVVDQPVLLKYLQEGRIAGAGLDVFADEPHVPAEFFSLDNAVLVPHVGSATHETRFAMGMVQVDNLRAMYADKPLLTPVV